MAFEMSAADAEIMEFSGLLLLEVAQLGGFPEAVVLGMVAALGRTSVTHHVDAWQLVDLLDEHWESLTTEQERSLTGALSRAFWLSTEEMFQFRVAELFGERLSPDAIVAWIGDRLEGSGLQTKVCAVHALADACVKARLGRAAPSPSVENFLLRVLGDGPDELRKEARRAQGESDWR